MKHFIIAMSVVSAIFASACGDKKSRKKSPGVTDNQNLDPWNPNGSNGNDPYCLDDVGQNDNCNQTSTGRMQIVGSRSWLNPEYSGNGRLVNHDGQCLQQASVNSLNDDGRLALDMQLANMSLKRNAASCRLQLQVTYPSGRAFGIRRVEVPLRSEIPVNSWGYFSGSYGINGKNPVVMQKTLDSRIGNRPFRLDYSVPNGDIVWSDCSGQATLVVDTKFAMEFSGSRSSSGDLQIEGGAPYRLEIVWSRCR